MKKQRILLNGLLALIANVGLAQDYQDYNSIISDEELLMPLINSDENYLPQQDQFYPPNMPEPVQQTLDFPLPENMPHMPSGGATSIPVDQLPSTPAHLQQQEFVQQEEMPFLVPEESLEMAQPMPLKEDFLPDTLFAPEESDVVSDVDVSRFGVLKSENQGFSMDLWQGVSRNKVEIFLDQVISKGLQSSAARRLVLRMMLSQTEAPMGEDEIDWLARRVDVLHKLGMVQSAKLLLDGSSAYEVGVANFDGMPKVWVENSILTASEEEACNFVREHLLNSDDTFWRRALLTCQAVVGDVRGLTLSLDLLTQDDRKDDPLLFQLLEAVATDGETPRLLPNTKFTPLQSSIYGAHPRLLTPDVVFRLPDTVLRKIMKNNELAITYRLQAAEKLVNEYQDSEDVKILSQLYDIIDFDDSLVKSSSVIEQAQVEVDGSMARALLWQAIRHTDLPSTKALTLRALWQRAEKEGFENLSGALLPRMRGISAEANLAWFSPYVIRATLKNGNLREAQQWWFTLKNNRSLSRDLAMKRTDLAVAFSLLDQKLEQGVLETWWKVQQPNAAKNARGIERVLSLLEANELQVPAEIWQQLYDVSGDSYVNQGEGPGSMWLRLLGTALENKQTGASLLLLLEPLVHAKTIDMTPDGIANVITGLRFLGLTDDATSMVLEALL